MRLGVVITAAIALILGAFIFTGRSGAWTTTVEIGFLVSVSLFLWMLVRVIAERLNALASHPDPGPAGADRTPSGR